MASRRGPDNTARIAISGTINGQNWANVFHTAFTTSSSITQGDLDTVTAAIAAAYKTRFAGHENADVAYTNAKAVLYAPGGGELISVAAMTGNGSASGALGDNAACSVVSWLTSVYWRGGKPRTYLPGVGGTVVSNGNELDSGEISSLTTAAASFRTDVNALTSGTITGTTLGFISFSSGNAPRATPVFFAYTGAIVHPRLGSQRRRLGKWIQ